MEPSAVPTPSPSVAPGIAGFAAVVWQAKYWVLASTVGPGLIAALVVLLTPAKYQATATFVLPTSSGSMNPLASLPIFSKESSPLTILYGVAASDRAYRIVSEKTKRPMLELRDSLHWEMDATTNQISVTAENTSKPRAIAVCQTAAAVMQQLNSDITVALAKTNLSTITPTLKVREDELSSSEDALLTFVKQLKTSPDPTQPLASGIYLSRLQDTVIDLGKVERQIEFSRSAAIKRGEPQSAIPSITGSVSPSWKQMVTQVEYDLRVSETKFGTSSPEVETLRRKLEVTRRQAQQEIAKYIVSVQDNVDSEIANLVSQKIVLEWQRDTLAQLAKIAPAESIELQRLVREVGARSDIVKTVRIQAEAARLQTDTYQIPFSTLQAATIDPTPTNKSMSKPVGISALFGFLISSFMIVSRRRNAA